jgi:predicted thioesterase
LAPVVVGERLVAEAEVVGEEGRKRRVAVRARRGEAEVFSGLFTCLVPERHVLEGRG